MLLFKFGVLFSAWVRILLVSDRSIQIAYGRSEQKIKVNNQLCVYEKLSVDFIDEM